MWSMCVALVCTVPTLWCGCVGVCVCVCTQMSCVFVIVVCFLVLLYACISCILSRCAAAENSVLMTSGKAQGHQHCSTPELVLFPAHTSAAAIFSGAKGGLVFLVQNLGTASTILC